MQRIRMKTLSATPDRSLQPEQVAVLPDEEALELIAGGFAVPVDRLGNDIHIPAEDLAALRDELLTGLAIVLDGGEDEGQGDVDGNGEKTPADDGTAGHVPVVTTEGTEESGAIEEPGAETAEDDEVKVQRRRRRSRET